MSFTWNTPDDVLNDLAKVTGVRGGFDSGFMIRGQKPPPPRADIGEEDEEIIARYGNIKESATERTQSYSPDFRGITKMLRMVEEQSPSKRKENFDSLNIQPAQVIVSKLNPNVSEFIPKRISASQTVDLNDKQDKNKREDIVSTAPITSAPQGLMDASSQIPNGTGEVPYVEKQKIEVALREKIKETAKANTLKEKKERNVAIATLLKLNSRGATAGDDSSSESQPKDTNNVSESQGPSKIILFTPDFFKVPVNEPEKTNTLPTPVPPSDTQNLTLTYDADMGISSRSLILARDPEVQEATKKVNGWFERLENGSESELTVSGPNEVAAATKANLELGHGLKPKTENNTTEKVPEPKAFPKTREELGPPRNAIIFKQKTVSSANSTSTSPTTVAKQPMGPRAFVPSQRAKELEKMYMEKKERSILLAKQKMDLWDRVQCELKERDEIIKKRREQNESGSSPESPEKTTV